MKTLFALVLGLIASFFIGAFTLFAVAVVGDQLFKLYPLDLKWYLLASVAIGWSIIYFSEWFSNNYQVREHKPEAKPWYKIWLDRFKW